MRQACSARGVIHVHTELSFDGALQVAHIAEKCRRRGLSFAAIADHAESMTSALLDRLVGECRANSDSGFVMMPGLEHRYRHGVHILALGQSRWATAPSIVDMLRSLADDGCALVAAHCSLPSDLPPELLEILTAVEIWNVSRDTRLLPTTRHFPVYKKWAANYPNLFAVGGLDMHKGNEWGCEVVLDSACVASSEAVLERLKAGQFSTRGRFLSFGSRPSGGVRNLAYVAGDALAAVRDLRNRVFR
jgi:hypothetical protein